MDIQIKSIDLNNLKKEHQDYTTRLAVAGCGSNDGCCTGGGTESPCK